MKSILRRTAAALPIAVLTCVLSSSVFAGQPKPAKSEHVETIGGGFIAHRQKDGGFTCRYGLSMRRTEAHSGTLYLRTQFENPQDRSKPFVVDSEVPLTKTEFQLQSPQPMRGLRARRNYKVEILVYDSAVRDHQIGRLVQQVQSPIDI
jgi:hypothetical protein